MTQPARLELTSRELRELRQRVDAIDAVGLSCLSIDIVTLRALIDEVEKRRVERSGG